MTDITTSPAPIAAGTGGVSPWPHPAPSLRAEWARYAAFVRRPRLPGRVIGIGTQGLLATLRMLGLDLLVMIVLVGIGGLVLLTGFELPDNEVSGLEWTAATVAMVVLAAPILEELAFRSWLSGRPGHVLAFVLAAGGLAGLLYARGYDGGSLEMPAVWGLAAALLFAALALYLLRRRGPMRWFAKIFPLFFVLATVAFALVHLLNYTEGALYVLLPLVLPQLVTGSMLGYLRVHYGLWAAMLMHVLHNGALVSVVMLATSLGESG